VKVLPISDRYTQFAREVLEELSSSGIRTEIDYSDRTLSNKIREAETKKIPYMAICGKREEESQTVSVRKHRHKEVSPLTIKELVKIVRNPK
jgi:threonyl-tRNA synthetase